MGNEPKNRVDLYMVILLVLAAALIFGVIGFAYGQQVATESAGLTNTTSTVNYSASAVPSATKTTTATTTATASVTPSIASTTVSTSATATTTSTVEN